MKTIKAKYLGLKLIAPLAIAIAVFFSSCGIDESINNSPNAINEENVKTTDGVYGLTISLQVAAGDFYSGDRSRVGSIMSWEMCAPTGLGRAQPVTWNSYVLQEDGPPDDMWKIGYRGVKIANDIVSFAPQVQFGTTTAETRNVVLGMAKSYKALILGELAAYYGSIPINIVGLDAAKFVSQADAYAYVQTLLDEALAHFATTATYTRDLNFKGNKDKWIATVHSLKARYYLHVMNYAKALSEAQLGIQDASGNLYAQYSDKAGEYSPWGHWSLTETGQPLRGEASFVNTLKASAKDGDKRLAEYFKPNSNGAFWGYAQRNKATADTNELNSQVTVTMNKYEAFATAFPFISANENTFILAEAKVRTGGDASAELNKMRAMYGLPAYTGSDQTGDILKQKYLSLFLEGQSYTDMRRTKTLKETAIPLRWPYPTTEKNANPNTPANSETLVIWTR